MGKIDSGLPGKDGWRTYYRDNKSEEKAGALGSPDSGPCARRKELERIA